MDFMNFWKKKKNEKHYCLIANRNTFLYVWRQFDVFSLLRELHTKSATWRRFCACLVPGYIKHLTANFPAGDDVVLAHRQRSATFSVKPVCRQRSVRLSWGFDASWQMRLPAKCSPLVDERAKRTPGAPLVLVIWFPHLKDISFRDPYTTLVSFREENISTLYSLSLSSSLPFSCRLSNYKLYWQLNEKTRACILPQQSEYVFVANAGILVWRLYVQGNLAIRSSPTRFVLRIHDFFRGSTTAMAIRVLKRTLPHTKDVMA